MNIEIVLHNDWESRFKTLPKRLPKLIQHLTEMLVTVPPEFRDDVMFETSSDVEIYYYREETASEATQRLNDQSTVLKVQEDLLRREYEKLKQKFEP